MNVDVFAGYNYVYRAFQTTYPLSFSRSQTKKLLIKANVTDKSPKDTFK